MTDYTKTTNFTAKDALSTGDPAKLIKGSDMDTEFDAISVAVATKYDSNDLASQAVAEALTSNITLMTPLRVSNVLADNGGMLEDIQALADPGNDTILGWDESANAIIGFTLGSGLVFSTTTIDLADAVAGAGLAISSKVLSVGVLTGLTANANDIGLTDVTKGTGQPLSLLSGVWDFDITALGGVEGSALSAGDSIIVDDGGVAKKVALQDMGLRVQTGQGTQTVAAGDMNSIMEFTATSTLTLPLNATVDLPIGVPIVLNMKHATQVLTITAAASVTLVSVFHPAGTAAASDTLDAGGSALLYKTAADVWVLSGDTST